MRILDPSASHEQRFLGMMLLLEVMQSPLIDKSNKNFKKLYKKQKEIEMPNSNFKKTNKFSIENLKQKIKQKRSQSGDG